MSYRIYRHPEGISLNGKEFVLDEEDKVMLFDTETDAVKLVADDIGEDVTVQELEEDHGIFIEENEDGKTNRTWIIKKTW